MDVPTHLEHLAAQGIGLADAAAEAGLDALVPTCPDWTVRDLVTHLSGVHRWATAYVGSGRDTPPGPDDALAEPPAGGDDDALLDWFRDGHAALVEALKAAPDDLACWSFLPAPSPLAFWARRQAHETTIHRVDADRAAGRRTPIDSALATDGIDELLYGFLARPRGSLVSDPPRSLAISSTDTGAAWTMAIGPERRTTTAGAAPDADCTVSGPAADVYLLLWNRGDRTALDVKGDASLLDLWRAKARVRWG